MRGIRLLIKNAFRSALRNMYQIFGLSTLIMLVALIISLLFSTSSSIVNAENNLRMESRVRDFVVTTENLGRINWSTDEKIKDEALQKIRYDIFSQIPNEQKSQEVYQEAVVNYLANKLGLEWTRTEGRSFNDLYNKKQKILIKTVAKFGGGIVDASEGDFTSTAQTDKLVITDGNSFSKDENQAKHQVVLQKTFAKENNIKIGDIIRVVKDSYAKDGTQLVVTTDATIKKNLSKVKGHWYDVYERTPYANASWLEVVGLGVSADFEMPIIDQTTTLPNIKKDLIAYISPVNFGFSFNKGDPYFSYSSREATYVLTSNADREAYYSFKTKSGDNKVNAKKFEEEYKKITMDQNKTQFAFENGDKNYLFNTRIKMFSVVTNAYNIIAIVLLSIVALIAAATVILMTKKYVDTLQRQIGCLKALGYKKREIVSNFLAIPLITSGIGCVIGYVLAIGVGQAVLGGFTQYFNIDFGGITFNFWAFIASVIVTFGIMLVIVFATSYVTIRLSPLSLLNGGIEKEVGPASRILKKMTIGQGFNARLRGALISSSFGKLIGMFFAIFLSTILMSATVMAPIIMKDNESQSFTGLNYKTEVEYTNPTWNNPLSFYRTYNPLYDDTTSHSEGWGLKTTDGLEKTSLAKKDKSDTTGFDLPQMSYGSGRVTSTTSPLPYTKNSSGKYVIDTKTVVQDVLENKISMYYYGFDIPNESGVGWSKMGYQLWKAVPIDLLQAFNQTTAGDTAVSSLKTQWSDYVNLERDLAAYSNDASNYFLSLFNFYKVFGFGVPLRYLEDTTNSDDAVKAAIEKMYKNLAPIGHDTLAPNFIKSTDATKYFKNLSFTNASSVEDDFEFHYINGKKVDMQYLDASKLLSQQDEVINLSIQLLRWFWSTTYDRIGTIIINTAFSRSPYFVRQKMLDAMKNNKQYALSFNIAPYNRDTDDIGIKLDATYNSKSGKSESTTLYGISSDEKTIDLGKGKNTLFDGTYDNANVIPIIINETMAVKTGKKVGSTLDMNYFYDEMQNKDGVTSDYDQAFYDGDNQARIADAPLTQLGFDKATNPNSTNSTLSNYDYLPESTMSYYAQSKSYPDTLVGSNGVGIVDGQAIAATSSGGSVNSLQMHQAVLNGDAKISTIKNSTKFKIVGIQNSYGKAQAWINNDQAKRMTHYDVAEKYLYNRFFWPQWQYTIASNSIEIPELKNFNFDDFKNYDKLKNAANSGNKGAKIVQKLFNAMYPIFNYKNSLDNKNYDLDQICDNTQRYGDYSAMGLNGGYLTKVTLKSIFGMEDDDNSTFNIGTVKDPINSANIITALGRVEIGDTKVFSGSQINDIEVKSIDTVNNTAIIGVIGSSTNFYTTKGNELTISFNSSSSFYVSNTTKEQLAAIDEEKPQTFLEGFAQGSTSLIYPVTTARQILEQITDIVNMVMILFLVVALVVSLTIIVLITSVIIKENAGFIATMKIMGYSDRYIVRQILGMYVAGIIVAFITGFIISWFGIKLLGGMLALNSSWVLPISFYAWYPLAVLTILFAIYALSTLIGWRNVRKINPLVALQFEK